MTFELFFVCVCTASKYLIDALCGPFERRASEWNEKVMNTLNVPPSFELSCCVVRR